MKESDGTVLFSRGPLEGGSAFTANLARKHQKPLLHIDLGKVGALEAEQILLSWLSENEVAVLNVAGSRENKAPGIQRLVMEIVAHAMRRRHEGS